MAMLGRLLAGTIITGFLAAGASPAIAQEGTTPPNSSEGDAVTPPVAAPPSAPADSSRIG